MSEYAKSGVDIKLEGKAVEKLLEGVELKELPGIFAKWLCKDGNVYGLSTDGVGSKLLCYKIKGDFSGAGFDLVAMNCTDLACEYIKPLLFTNYLAVNKPDPDLAEELGKSLGEACKKAGVISAGGETASLSDQIKEGTFDWAATVFGIEKEERHKKWINKRDNLKEGLKVVGIKSSGIHSNGLTLARKLYERKLMDVNDPVPESDKTLIEELTTPTKIYSPLMLELRDLADGFVHVTGGGYSNILRVLPENLESRLELPEWPPIFKTIQEKLKVSEEEMCKVFNLGFGLLVFTEEPDEVMDVSERYGEESVVLGELKKGDRKVVVGDVLLRKYG